MTRILLLLLLLYGFTARKSYAQEKAPGTFKAFYLRTNFLSFAELDAGIMAGARYQWSKKFSATLDPTIIFFYPYINQDGDLLHPFGVKLRADVRYHFGRSVLDLPGLFIAPELHFKSTSRRRWATFGFNCIGQNCAYYMETTYREIKTEAGASLKMGIDLPVDNKKRLSLEIYGGLGFKVVSYKEKSIPVGGSFSPGPPLHQSFLNIPEGNAVPIIPASIKVSYRIR